MFLSIKAELFTDDRPKVKLYDYKLKACVIVVDVQVMTYKKRFGVTPLYLYFPTSHKPNVCLTFTATRQTIYL